MKYFSILLACCALFGAVQAQTFGWSIAPGGPKNDFALATTADGAGNYLITGKFEDSLDLDPSSGTTLLLTTNDPYLSDIFLAKYDGTGGLLWGFGIGSNKNDEGLGVSTDAAGNVYLAGEFSGTVDFDPGTGTSILSSSVSGGQMFVAKYSPNGALVWVRHIASTSFGDNAATHVALDGSGNVYMQGYFQGTIDLDPGPAVVPANDGGGTSICIVKLDPAGNYVWGFAAGNSTLPKGMDVAANGDVVVCGEVFANSDMDPGPGTASLTVHGLSDIYIAKYSSTGSHQWSYAMGSSNSDNVDTEEGRSVRFLPNGDVALWGQFRDTYDSDPGTAVRYLMSQGGSDLTLSRFSSSGALVWSQSYGNNTDDWALAMDVDAAGNLYLAAKMFGTYDLDPGTGTIWYSNMDASPTLLTTTGSGTYLGYYRTLRASGAYRYLSDICMAPGGDLLVTGRFDYQVNCDSTLAPQHLHTCQGATDVILAHYGPTVVSVTPSLTEPGIAIGPNPAPRGASMLHVQSNEPLHRLQLVSLQGAVIAVWQAAGELRMDLPLSGDISSGMYLLQVETATGMTAKRVMVR